MILLVNFSLSDFENSGGSLDGSVLLADIGKLPDCTAPNFPTEELVAASRLGV